MAGLTVEQIQNKLNEKFPGKITSVTMEYDFPVFVVTHEAVRDVIAFLYHDEEMNFKFLTTCCGLHFPDADEKFAMMYQLHNLQENCRIRIKSFTHHDQPVFHTITDLYKAAGWMEREAYDFFGFRFTGHKDMRRILNMDSLEGWPLRKEYPLEDPFRKDKDDAMFGR